MELAKAYLGMVEEFCDELEEHLRLLTRMFEIGRHPFLFQALWHCHILHTDCDGRKRYVCPALAKISTTLNYLKLFQDCQAFFGLFLEFFAKNFSGKTRKYIHKVRLWSLIKLVHMQRSFHGPLAAKLTVPVTQGWGNYFCAGVSSEIFSKMDHLLFQKLWVWAKRRHPKKGRKWIANKYWHINQGRWKFGTNEDVTLARMSDIPSKRHIAVKGNKSPYDGDAIYWSIRMGRHPEMPHSLARLLKKQNGYCPKCGRLGL